jgi:cytidine deaminase
MAKIELTDEKIKQKIDEAIEIMEKAYVPYSKFPVAAILIWISPICLEHVVPKVSKIC